MKYMYIILNFIILVSYSHNSRHNHEKSKTNHYNWSQELMKIQKERNEMKSLFNWFENHLKDHKDTIQQHNFLIKSHKNKIVSNSTNKSSLKEKKR